jgi:hypothetical protein
MQRKNSILRYSHKARAHRNGMALIMAIAVIVIIATIMTLSLSLTATTSKKTTDLYLYEQSVLLSKSATEYALLKIAENAPCTYRGGNFTYNSIYDINISVSYVYNDASTCTDLTPDGPLYTTVETDEQNGSVLIDVSVGVNNSTVTTEPIRYFRRSIQKL